MYGQAPPHDQNVLTVTAGLGLAAALVIAGLVGIRMPQLPKRVKSLDLQPIPDPTMVWTPHAGEPCWINGSTVNVRKGPSTRTGIVAKKHDGNPVRCMDPQKGWHAIAWTGTVPAGYVRDDLLDMSLPRSYKKNEKEAASHEKKGDFHAAMNSWLNAARIGQQESDAFGVVPDAFFRAMLGRVGDSAVKSTSSSAPRSREASGKVPIAEADRLPEIVLALFRKLAIRSDAPALLLVDGDEPTRWIVVYIPPSSGRINVYGGLLLREKERKGRAYFTLRRTMNWDHSASGTLGHALRKDAVEGRVVQW